MTLKGVGRMRAIEIAYKGCLFVYRQRAHWTLNQLTPHSCVGLGHGVGAALNVHEGPQSISTRYWITTPLQQGMVCSNEPGYYEDGSFGVRIENLVIVNEANTEYRWGTGSTSG